MVDEPQTYPLVNSIVRWLVIGVIVILGVVVACMPGLVYAPVPKVVLLFLVAILPAILLGAEAGDRLQLNLGWLVAVVGGSAAVCFLAFYLLMSFAKPEQQIAAFQIYDEQGNPVSLEWEGAYQVAFGSTALQATTLTKGNQLVVIFPEQVASVQLSVRKSSQGPWYRGALSYSGNRTYEKHLGRDLVRAQ